MRTMRIRVVIEELNDQGRYGAVPDPVVLAERALGQIDAERLAIVEQLYPASEFAETALRVFGGRVETAVRDGLTTLLGEVGGALGQKLKAWAERPAAPAGDA